MIFQNKKTVLFGSLPIAILALFGYVGYAPVVMDVYAQIPSNGTHSCPVINGTVFCFSDDDGDGLSNDDEINEYHTDPNNPDDPFNIDSDGDGLTDWEEISRNPFPTDRYNVDTDDDGINDYDEINVYGTNPTRFSSDPDGISDGDEINLYGTNPLDIDTDNDGFTDDREIEVLGTNPLEEDSDGDGLWDYAEAGPFRYGTNATNSDTDGDGRSDSFELQREMNPLGTDTDGDDALDGLDGCPTIPANNPVGCPELTPSLPDTDGDGRWDIHDACPDVAGDNLTGCPLQELDWDGDNVVGAADSCPSSFDNASDGDGCPHHSSSTFRSIQSSIQSSAQSSTQSPNTGSGGCDGDCQSPTIGKLSSGRQYVTEGFSFNGVSTDVTAYHTEYPLINTTIGVTNTIHLKIYENQGPSNIKMVRIGVGIEEPGKPMNSAEGQMQVMFERTGSEINEIKLVDPNNILANVTGHTHIAACNPQEVLPECLHLAVHYTHREAPIHHAMMIVSSDNEGNSKSFYLNDGYDVIGKSMNPDPVTLVAASSSGHPHYPEKRGTVELTRTDKDNNIWTDEFGFEWQLDQFGFKLISYVPYEHKHAGSEGILSGYDRDHPKFKELMQSEHDKAYIILKDLYDKLYRSHNPLK